MKIAFRIIAIGFLLNIICVLIIWSSDNAVKRSASERLYNSSKEIPHNKVGLLLGTAKHLQNGTVNLYYKYRISAAVELYKTGKIEHLLVSGDNSKKDYDEPSTMKEDLIAQGIPAEKIHLDYAGFRTLDSVIRSNKIFGQSSITIISQQFHNERALYIAKRKGITAIGFNAQDVSARYGIKVQIRELFARVKMMLDLSFKKGPKFLGESVEIK